MLHGREQGLHLPLDHLVVGLLQRPDEIALDRLLHLLLDLGLPLRLCSCLPVGRGHSLSLHPSLRPSLYGRPVFSRAALLLVLLLLLLHHLPLPLCLRGGLAP